MYYGSMQVQYGQLKGCFNVSGGNDGFCIILMFYRVEVKGQQILNELDCPLLEASSHLVTVNSTQIISPVSIIHECTSCTLQAGKKKRKVERQEVEVNMHHDFKNKLFSLNLYCMNAIFE